MIQSLHRAIELVEGGWNSTRVLIVGDVMLDCYIWGEVERISPEAPVPIVRTIHRNERPGGAANVAMNIAGLGAKATLIGFSGKDSEAGILENGLRQCSIEPQLVPIDGCPTTTKLRIVGGKQQMLRLDTEHTAGYPAEAIAELLRKVDEEIQSADVVILSDYAKGVLTEQVCQHVIQAARRKGIRVLVDPKQRDLRLYRGATTICPNRSELSHATGVAASALEELLAAGQKLVSALEVEFLTATLSELGIAVLREQTRTIAPAVARQVFDVSGAGDTVIATLALCLANGLEVESTMRLANIAAGIVVGKIGTVPISRDELLIQLMPEMGLQSQEKVLSADQLKVLTSAWRSSGERVVFTNGCFDLLHVGHVTLLEDARREGDRLIVAINTDNSVRCLKGPTRPVVSEKERARVLAALASVDAIVMFDEPTPLELIQSLQPDVIVKGGDYTEETVVGAKEARAWGGRVKIVPTVEGFSTTRLIAKAGQPEIAPDDRKAPLVQ